jgi:hypothetical protein
MVDFTIVMLAAGKTAVNGTCKLSHTASDVSLAQAILKHGTNTTQEKAYLENFIKWRGLAVKIMFQATRVPVLRLCIWHIAETLY